MVHIVITALEKVNYMLIRRKDELACMLFLPGYSPQETFTQQENAERRRGGCLDSQSRYGHSNGEEIPLTTENHNLVV